MAQVPAPQPERHLAIAPQPGDAVRVALAAAFQSLVEHSSELRRGSTDPEEIHDARVAALCRQHGVRELWLADRDFNRFAGLTVVNPLLGNGQS